MAAWAFNIPVTPPAPASRAILPGAKVEAADVDAGGVGKALQQINFHIGRHKLSVLHLERTQQPAADPRNYLIGTAVIHDEPIDIRESGEIQVLINQLEFRLRQQTLTRNGSSCRAGS